MLVGEFVSVAMGLGFGCAVRADGELVCWGTAGDESLEPPVGTFKVVAVALEHACAVRSDGGLVCWGGDGWADVVLPAGEFTAVSVAEVHACGIRAGGEVACWGVGRGRDWGPPGKFTSIASGGHDWFEAEFSCGVQVGGGVSCWRGREFVELSSAEFVSVGVGGNYACGVRADGALECWGQRRPGACTPDFWGRLHGNFLTCWGWNAYPGSAPPGPFTAVAVSWFSTFAAPAQICAALVGGEVVCWNDSGVPLSLPPAGEFAALDVSRSLSCGLRPGGRATCWGVLEQWEPGPDLRWRPAQGAFVSVSAGTEHACGVRAGGEVACWGLDFYGETRAPGGVFDAVSAGRRFSCGLRPGGEVECWGANQWWESTPLPGPFAAVYAADSYACGIRPGGRAECWGRDRGAGRLDPPGRFVALELAAGCGIRPGGDVACWGDDAPPAGAVPTGPFTAISGVGGGGCGLRPAGDVACWGDFAGWAPPGRFEALSVAHGVCGIRADDTVDCRRDGTQPARRQLTGDAVFVLKMPWTVVSAEGRWFEHLSPAGIPDSLLWVQHPLPAGPFAGLAAGGLCGIRADGRLDCWGSTEIRGSEGARLDPDVSYESVAFGYGYWCGLSAGGELDCAGGTSWDDIPYEQWGAAHPPPAGRFAAVAVGIERACAVPVGAGEVSCWGPGAADEQHAPPSGAYTAISIGESHERADPDNYTRTFSQHACALRADGEVVCWGDDDNGKIRVPPERLGAAPYRAVTAGGEHTCALRANGEILCWGDNTYGQTEAPDGTYTAITAGRWHTCALAAEGDASCWGDGVTADVGDGPPDIDPPVGTANTAPPPGPFTAISAGAYHTCALDTDGEVACWYSY